MSAGPLMRPLVTVPPAAGAEIPELHTVRLRLKTVGTPEVAAILVLMSGAKTDGLRRWTLDTSSVHPYLDRVALQVALHVFTPLPCFLFLAVGAVDDLEPFLQADACYSGIPSGASRPAPACMRSSGAWTPPLAIPYSIIPCSRCPCGPCTAMLELVPELEQPARNALAQQNGSPGRRAQDIAGGPRLRCQRARRIDDFHKVIPVRGFVAVVRVPPPSAHDAGRLGDLVTIIR